MGWTHGQNERWEITEKIRDNEARWLQKTRKTTAKMGGLCEERPEKGRGGRKVERKGQQQGPMETNYKSSRTSEWRIDQPHPYTSETRGRNFLDFLTILHTCLVSHVVEIPAPAPLKNQNYWTALSVFRPHFFGDFWIFLTLQII